MDLKKIALDLISRCKEPEPIIELSIGSTYGTASAKLNFAWQDNKLAIPEGKTAVEKGIVEYLISFSLNNWNIDWTNNSIKLNKSQMADNAVSTLINDIVVPAVVALQRVDKDAAKWYEYYQSSLRYSSGSTTPDVVHAMCTAWEWYQSDTAAREKQYLAALCLIRNKYLGTWPMPIPRRRSSRRRRR